MGFAILFCTVFLQIASGQVAQYTGQNAISNGQPFVNINARGLVPNSLLARNVANGFPFNNQYTNNAVNGVVNAVNANLANVNGNSNILNGNFVNANLMNPYPANANLANANIANANLANANLPNANIASANFAAVPNPNPVYGSVANHYIAKNIASTKSNLEATNYANLGYSNANWYNQANANFVNTNSARGELGSQLYSSNCGNAVTQTNKAIPVSGNVVSPYAVNTGNLNGNVVNGLRGMVTPNVAKELNTNLGLSNAFGDGNIAGAVNTNFAIGGNPFQVLSGLSDSQPFGLHIVADTLEVGGTVSVTGKMPIYGTVSLNGNLPTDGAANVNYGCNSLRNG